MDNLILEYSKSFARYALTKQDSELYAISDAIEQLSYEQRIDFREKLKSEKMPILPNLTYDYKNQCWITLSNGKLWK